MTTKTFKDVKVNDVIYCHSFHSKTQKVTEVRHHSYGIELFLGWPVHATIDTRTRLIRHEDELISIV